MTIIRLCCMQSHDGPICPDGKVMCCLCFDRVEQSELSVDPADGKKVDVCKPCAERERQQVLTHMPDMSHIDPSDWMKLSHDERIQIIQATRANQGLPPSPSLSE